MVIYIEDSGTSSQHKRSKRSKTASDQFRMKEKINIADLLQRGALTQDLLLFLQKDSSDSRRHETQYTCETRNLAIQEVFDVTQELRSLPIEFLKSVPGKASRRAYEKRCEALVGALERQLNAINRVLTQQSGPSSVWLIYPVWLVARQYYAICTRVTSRLPNQRITWLERCARSVYRCFALCLNDRTPDCGPQDSRRAGCHLFANLELQIYHALRNRDMILGLMQVLRYRSNELPNIEEGSAKHFRSEILVYHYFMAEHLGCYERDYEKALKELESAWKILPKDLSKRNGVQQIVVKILALMIPFGLAIGKIVKLELVLKSLRPELQLKINDLYRNSIEALRCGSLRRYDNEFERHETEFLEMNVYVAMTEARTFVLRRLLQLTWRLTGKPSVVELRILLKAMQMDSKTQESDEKLLNHLEGSMASLIGRSMIKGYLSHSRRCLVLSKRDPFPRNITI